MITEFMIGNHRQCDEFFAQAEKSAVQEDAAAATAHFKQFLDSLEHHFSMEEEILFPRIEEISGHNQGPTVVMRGEHEQMRRLMAEMAFALDGKDTGTFLDDCESFMILMQQHNFKEENVLYPMADQLLAAEADQLIEKMQPSES